MSQKKDLAGNSGPEDDLQTEQDFAMYRVPLSQVEEMTNLHFGKLSNNCTECQRLDQRKPLADQLA